MIVVEGRVKTRRQLNSLQQEQFITVKPRAATHDIMWRGDIYDPYQVLMGRLMLYTQITSQWLCMNR